jgi:HEAT repeat protein
VPLLLRSLARDEVILSAASAMALGDLGVPEALPGLEAALGHGSAVTRAAAATALGQVGSDRSARALAGAFEDDDRVLSRRVAAALLRLGPLGHAALAANPSPYAAEALAVGRLRGEVQWTP